MATRCHIRDAVDKRVAGWNLFVKEKMVAFQLEPSVFDQVSVIAEQWRHLTNVEQEQWSDAAWLLSNL
jgi:hypothetical protein